MTEFIICSVVLIILVVLASKFADIAETKGYDRKTYFWVCFLLGAIGYIMVAALPDLAIYSYIKKLNAEAKKELSNVSTLQTKGSPTVRNDGGWVCRCGVKHAAYVTSCICGTKKRDILTSGK